MSNLVILKWRPFEYKAEFAKKVSLICGALRDLVPCTRFKKREKHPWRSVTFSKVAGFSLQLY